MIDNSQSVGVVKTCKIRELSLNSKDMYLDLCDHHVFPVRRHLCRFYRAMHFSAKRGIAIVCRLSIRLSVTLVNCDHIGWNSSKIISPLVSLRRSLFATPT